MLENVGGVDGEIESGGHSMSLSNDCLATGPMSVDPWLFPWTDTIAGVGDLRSSLKLLQRRMPDIGLKLPVVLVA